MKCKIPKTGDWIYSGFNHEITQIYQVTKLGYNSNWKNLIKDGISYVIYSYNMNNEYYNNLLNKLLSYKI